MRRINTLEELRAEHRRLSLKRIHLEAEIKKDFRDIRESLEPMNLIREGAQKALRTGKSTLLGTSAGSLANLLVKTTLKNSGLFSRVLIPFIVKKLTARLVDSNKGRLMDMVGSIFYKRKTLSGKTEVTP